MRREPTVEEVMRASDAYWAEGKRWRVLDIRNGETTAAKAVRDQLPRPGECSPEQLTAMMNEQVEFFDLADREAAHSYIHFRAMKAALMSFAAPSRLARRNKRKEATAGATSQL